MIIDNFVHPVKFMLSICIPVYNFDVTSLVFELNKQCLKAEITYEIICYDDGSQEYWKEKNRPITDIPQLNYKELLENVGRSRIRNLLGKAARYPYLIFMDCDSKVVSPSYITAYLNHLHPQHLLYGGRVYSKAAPQNKAIQFHWYYGKMREQVTAKVRSKSPHHSFMTNNFLIPRALFLGIQFDENLKQYGHEDTVFGLELKHRQIEINHLDNPLEHIGLEPTAVFIKKTKRAIENLWYLAERNELMDTKLLRVFRQSQSWRLTVLLTAIFDLFAKQMENYLQKPKPNLKVFDLYKLAYLAKISRR